MTRLSAAAIVVALVAVLGGVLLFRAGDQSVGGPPATPSHQATATSSPSATSTLGVPTGLEGTWMGGPKPELSLVEGAGSTLQVDPFSIVITQSASARSPALIALPTFQDGGRLRVEASGADPAGCAKGATGEYTWDLTPSGRQLTITAGSDPCASRRASLPGTWHLMGCKQQGDNCLGELDPGTYATQFVTPRLQPGQDWAPRYGAVTYTVPEGWANAADWPEAFELVPSDTYVSYGPEGGPEGVHHEVDILAHPAMAAQTSDCSGTEATGVERTVDGFTAWLWDHPSLRSARPVAMTIDGHPAKSIDVELAPDWTGTCPELPAGSRAAVILTNQGADGGNGAIEIVDDERLRLIFVDLGKGDLVAIIVDATDPATFDELAAQAMPIIQSMTFE